MLVSVYDVVFRKEFLPDGSGFVVALQAFLGRAFKNSCVQILWVEFQYVYQVLPSPFDGFFLEVVAEAPVAQHLEHCVVVGIVSYLLKVVVLSANAQTLL